MARSIGVETVQIYRALVERLDPMWGEWKPWTVFGPYVTRGACIDHDARWHRQEYEQGTRRLRKQKLMPVLINGILGLEWQDC